MNGNSLGAAFHFIVRVDLLARILRPRDENCELCHSGIKFLFLAQRCSVHAMLRGAQASEFYFAVNEATCAQGCASAHAITSCEQL